MDRLERVGFAEWLAPGRVYLSTHEAVTALECPTPPESDVGPPGEPGFPASPESRGARPARVREEGVLPS